MAAMRAGDSRQAMSSVKSNESRGVGMFLEDFEVGQLFSSGTRRLSEEDLFDFTRVSGDRNPIHLDQEYAKGTRFGQRVLHGPLGLAVAFGLLHAMGIVDKTAVALLDAHWRFVAPLFVDDQVDLSVLVTRCRRTSEGETGVVNRYMRLVNQDGKVVQEGTSAMLVRARGPRGEAEDRTRARRDFCTLGWGRLLAQRLQADESFANATGTFDGTIGLQADDETVYLKTYLGRVIDVTRRPQLPPDFVIQASEAAWVQFSLGERNDYIARAMHGEFTTLGSNFQYLRLTRAVLALMDSVRALAREGE